jgi:hypothetical protein
MTVYTSVEGDLMATPQSKQSKRERGRRHPLLLYQRFNEVVFWPSILIVAIIAALLIWNPAELGPHRRYFSVILVSTGLILVLTFVFRLRAYVQCRDSGLWIQVPLYHLTIPYAEIRASRPTDLFRLFPPNDQPHLRRHFLEPLLGKTVVVVDLLQLPWPRSRLRLWMSHYMLSPETEGLVLPLRDWIDFRTELDDFRLKQRRYLT